MSTTFKRRRKKRKAKHVIYSNASIVLLVLITAFLGYQVFGLHKKWNVSEIKRAEAVAELERQMEEEESLRERIEEIQTPEGRERAIRERFNVVKEGEGVIYVVEEDRSIGSDIILDREESEKNSFFESIRNFFKF
jgi:cell division protein FtsB